MKKKPDTTTAPKNKAPAANTPRERYNEMAKAARRYQGICAAQNIPPDDHLSTMMDLEAADNQFNMDWPALNAADEFNFSHDVFGIKRHIDCSAPTIGDCFVPRFAR